jgi:hypothetical protein
MGGLLGKVSVDARIAPGAFQTAVHRGAAQILPNAVQASIFPGAAQILPGSVQAHIHPTGLEQDAIRDLIHPGAVQIAIDCGTISGILSVAFLFAAILEPALLVAAITSVASAVQDSKSVIAFQW